MYPVNTGVDIRINLNSKFKEDLQRVPEGEGSHTKDSVSISVLAETWVEALHASHSCVLQ